MENFHGVIHHLGHSDQIFLEHAVGFRSFLPLCYLPRSFPDQTVGTVGLLWSHM